MSQPAGGGGGGVGPSALCWDPSGLLGHSASFLSGGTKTRCSNSHTSLNVEHS